MQPRLLHRERAHQHTSGTEQSIADYAHRHNYLSYWKTDTGRKIELIDRNKLS